jgi:hypothetical protein
MSWFQYGTPTKRSLRKGVWLRVSDLPEPITKQAKKYLSKNENIDWIIVSEIHPNNKVSLEFWCHKIVPMKANKPTVYKVFHLLVDENPEWTCEGDLGRGYK